MYGIRLIVTVYLLEEVRSRVAGSLQKSTANANNWAFDAWKSWAGHRNRLPATNTDVNFPVAEDLLDTPTVEDYTVWDRQLFRIT